MPELNHKNHHLIVLVHGLWGSSSNLARFESVIHHSLETSEVCNFHTYAPSCFSHFKTYDGVEAIGDYVLVDLFKHLKILKEEHSIVINQISFIGYSLGGLITRYVIGELYRTGFFKEVEPYVFATMATPHLGCTFYNHTRFLNVLGSNLLGQTGKDLFLVEGEAGIVYRLSDPDECYYQGLQQFKSRIVTANSKFDRTVGFYSAFITNYDVFDDWNKVEPRFIDGLPTAVIDESGQLVECLVIDFKETKRLPDTSTIESPESHAVRFLLLGTLMLFLSPVVFSVSLFATVKSYFRVRILPKPNLHKIWRSISLFSLDTDNEATKDNINDSDGYNEEENLQSHTPGISHLTRTVVETGLNILEEDNVLEKTTTNTSISDEIKENYDIDLKFTLEYKSRKSTVRKLLNNIVSDDLSSLDLVQNVKPLIFSPVRSAVLQNLNTIEWKKIAVLGQNLNSHQSIIGRRGFNRTPESIPFLFLFSHVLEETVKGVSK